MNEGIISDKTVNNEGRFLSRVIDANVLPDCQSGPTSAIKGAPVPILKVGISGFRLPLRYLTKDDRQLELETSVTGSVSLSADKKGIHMSRIMRTFYNYKERIFNLELLEEVLEDYKSTLESSRASLKLNFNYPILQKSLRSELSGYQYYNVALEGNIDDLGRAHKYMHFDFVYSSACPCSAELSEHSREYKGIRAIAHSQRSKARISIEVYAGEFVSVEDIQEISQLALKTETQVMVKREDEQAFAELNGQHTKFVEDAVRLLYEPLNKDTRIKDFQVACVHLESLHSHNAVAVINKGVPGGFSGEIMDFESFVC